MSPAELAGQAIAPTVLNRWTFAYAGAGAGMRRLGFTVIETGVVAVAWEVAQRPLKEAFPGVFPDPQVDTLLGAAVDVGAMLLGWYVLGLLDDRPGPGA